MKSALPLVTIGVPTYNSARYLQQTLDSLTAQSYGNLEVVISDNASTDDSLAIANEYAERFGFRVLANATNNGAFGNWNRILQAARGEYVALYHSDDVYGPTIVEECVGLLEREPEVGLVGTLATVIDEAGLPRYELQLPSGTEPGALYRFPEAFRSVLRNGANRFFWVTPSVMVRASIYRDLGAFDTSGSFGSAGDYEMWLRIAAGFPVAVIPRPLMSYRVHEEQGSERELRRNVGLPDIVAVLEKYVPLVNSPDVAEEYRRYRSRTYLKTALKQNCRREYERSCATAACVGAGRYLLPALALRLACRLRLNICCWPGRPWPCRVAPEVR